MKETRDEQRILAGKSLGKRPLGKMKRKCNKTGCEGGRRMEPPQDCTHQGFGIKGVELWVLFSLSSSPLIFARSDWKEPLNTASPGWESNPEPRKHEAGLVMTTPRYWTVACVVRRSLQAIIEFNFIAAWKCINPDVIIHSMGGYTRGGFPRPSQSSLGEVQSVN
jgi:hypothetical protein